MPFGSPRPSGNVPESRGGVDRPETYFLRQDLSFQIIWCNPHIGQRTHNPGFQVFDPGPFFGSGGLQVNEADVAEGWLGAIG